MKKLLLNNFLLKNIKSGFLKNENIKDELFEDEEENSHSSNSSSIFKRANKQDKNKKNLEKLKQKNHIDESSDIFGLDTIKPNKKNEDFFTSNDLKLPAEANKKESEFPSLNNNFQNSKLIL